MVLAAGKGERLKPFTETRPKPLIPILDRPLISYPLELLKRINVSHSIIVVSYMKDLLIDRVKAICNELDMSCEFVEQGKELGTAHAVERALEKASGEDLIVVYGDIYVDPDAVAHSLVRAVERREPFIMCVRVDDVSRYGAVRLQGSIAVSIEEKPPSKAPGVAYAGVMLIPKDLHGLVSEIKASPRGEYELTDLVSMAYRCGRGFRAIEVGDEVWHDVGYPWSIIEVHKKLLSKIDKKVVRGSVDQHVVIKGPVIVEEGAEVRGFTYIMGPAYIGRDVVVGPSAFVRPYSVIMHGSHIGFSVEIKESVVMEHAHAAHLTYIGDSVVGENVNLGAGTLLANLRFDEKNVKVTIKGKRIDSGRRKLGALIGGFVKTGVNVSIVPGVKIGSYAIIYPGVTVYRDVPSRAVVKDTYR
ncbi:MAG: NTP transferase domain-containing protein [Crenarchaeota archaeon]|nr:NTP transferase domain-containing protein [Thermoproteota archaeon]